MVCGMDGAASISITVKLLLSRTFTAHSRFSFYFLNTQNMDFITLEWAENQARFDIFDIFCCQKPLGCIF